MGWLLNNPVVLTIIVLVVVLIAVGLILYFLVFKNKIKAKIAANKDRHLKHEQDKTKSQALASNIFADKEIEEEKLAKQKLPKKNQNLDERLKIFVKRDDNPSLNAQNFHDQVNKKEEKAEVNTKDALAFMNQFGNKKTEKAPASKPKAKTDDKDKKTDTEKAAEINSKTGNNYMGQFKNKK